MRTLRVLSLGGGRQSTALYVMAARGLLKPKIDVAIFADTLEEPKWVYANLDWMRTLGGPEILIRTIGRLGDHLVHGVNSTGQRFASIPAFTLNGETVGQTRRQCTKEYKLQVIKQTIRRELLGLAPGRRVCKGTQVHQSIGFTIEEQGRALRMAKQPPHWFVNFPLIELMASTEDCLRLLERIAPHKVRKSACVFCPYRDDAEWADLKQYDPDGWDRAVHVDRSLRVKGNVMARGLDAPLFVHRSCQPLELVQLNPIAKPQMRMSFASECLGMCGL